jgi:hypothetical protein
MVQIHPSLTISLVMLLVNEVAIRSRHRSQVLIVLVDPNINAESKENGKAEFELTPTALIRW